MTRGLTAGMVTELTASARSIALLVETEWSSGYVRLWSGLGTLSWDGKSWTSAAGLIGVQPAAETLRVEAAGAVFTLNGLTTSLLSAALSQARQGMPVNAWLAFLDSTGAVIADPYQWYGGRMDVPEIEHRGDGGTLTVNTESRLAILQRAPGGRYTDEDQQARYAGDLGYEYVASLANATFAWGSTTARLNTISRRPAPQPDDPTEGD
ncbi:MAG: hypothetical protein HY323_07265 [Betaproteobacteria bacterium]|nr:hypothetical protein [Betaproteobacteria bacterium]